MEQVVIGNLLKEIRGSKTQKVMSEDLGLSADKYYKWEAGYAKLSYEDFVTICENQQLNLKKIYHYLFNFKAEFLDQKYVLNKIIEQWWSFKEGQIPEKLSISKSKWRRIRSAESPVSFSDFIRIVELVTGHSTTLLSEISSSVKNHLKPEVSPEDVIEILKKDPSFSSIFSATNLEAYKQCNSSLERVQFLARSTGLPKNHIVDLLNVAGEKNIRFCDANDKGIPVKVALATCDMETNDRMSQTLLDRQKRMYEFGIATRDNIRSVPIVASVTKESVAKVHLAMTKCMNDIARIISEDVDKDKTELVHVILSADNTNLSNSET